MDVFDLAAVMTVIGSILFLVAAMPLSRIYGGRDPEGVIAEIRAHWTAYRASQVMFGAGAVVAGAGLALMAVRLADTSGPALPVIGAVSTVGGGVMWALMAYDRTVDFERAFREYGSFGWRAVGWLVLTGLGLAVYGLLFRDAGYPDWVAYGTWLLAALQVGGAVIAPKVVPPQIYYLATLLLGLVVLLRV